MLNRPAPGSPARFAAAAGLLNSGAITEAENAYRELIRVAPARSIAYIGAARCARRRGDAAASLTYLAQAPAGLAEDPAIMVERATDLLALNRIGEAEAVYCAVITAVPENLRALLGAGQCARRRGDRPCALARFRAAAAAAPEQIQPLLEVAVELRQMHRFDEARAVLDQLLASAPGDVGVHLGIGYCARQQGDLPAALSAFQAASLLAPADPRPRLEAAALLRERGEFDAAAALYQQLLSRSPGNSRALHGLGVIARQRGDRAAALAHFQAAAGAGGDVGIRLEIAVEQRDAGDADAARQTAAAVLARYPGNLPALMSLGHTERHANRPEQALAAFAMAHEAAPGAAEPLVEMALELRRLGRQSECEQRLAEAVALDPESPTALLRLAEQAMTARDLQTAYDAFQRAAALRPASVPARLGVAECLARLARVNEALALLAVLQTKFGALPAILGKRVVLLRQSGDYPQALQLARQAAAAAPGSFQLGTERFHCEMLLGTDDDVQAALAALRPATVQQQAVAARLHGNRAESHFNFDEAVRHYEEACRLNPADAGVHAALSRCRMLTFDLPGARRHLAAYVAGTAHLARLAHKSVNLSQSMNGQIIDEFCLEPVLAGEIETLQRENPQRRVARLVRLTLENQDSTAAAIALLIALRQLGAFGPRDHSARAAAPVPNTIIQFWDSEEIPDDVNALMDSWRRHNPTFTHITFTDAKARDYLQEFFAPPVLHAYLRGDGAAQKADIFRLAYLTREGGVYADADDRCNAPLEVIIRPATQLLLYQEYICSAGNNFIAARPRHPVLAQALGLAAAALNRGDRDNVWLGTGPGLLTRALARHLAQTVAQTGAMPPGLTLLDRRQLYQAVACNCILGYKHSNRHWVNAAFARQR